MPTRAFSGGKCMMVPLRKLDRLGKVAHLFVAMVLPSLSSRWAKVH